MGKKRDILIYLWWTMMIVVILASAGCTKHKSEDLEKLSGEEQELITLSNSYFGILADTASNEANPLSDERVKLGKMLFHDARLSKSGFISCNSCHNLASYGVDNLPTSVGHNWQIGNRNAPTVLNAAFHITQFWNGRAKDVEEQATMPILNPVEMAIPHEEVSVETIASISEYVQMFSEAFPQEEKPLNLMNIGKAIGAFERTLITPSRFDQYLAGDAQALNAQEKRGLRAFIDANCQTCHMTPLLGGTIYQKFGIMKDYWELTWSDTKDKDRADITKNDDEMYFFKVPSLRNVARTYPYFHDGSIWDLKQAVSIMNELQVGKKLENNEVEDIVAFLESLTGKIPESALILPILPPSGSLTPKPDMR
jgi:cytochrome c peroxidase